MLRVAICQYRIPGYRAPVYNLLGAQPDIDLTVFAGPSPAAMGGREESIVHFRHVLAESRVLRWLPGGHSYQDAQLEVVDPSRFDLAIMMWNTRFRSLGPALRRARRRRFPVALWGHGFSKRPSLLRDAFRNHTGRRADAVLLYTRTVADDLVAHAGFARDRVFVAQNALDQAPIQAARRDWLGRPDDLAAFRREHRLDPDATIVFVSRLLATNRVPMLIEGLARLREVRPEARLVIVGEGPERGALEDLARDRGQSDHVTFAGALFDETALAPWMLSATLLCYPVNIGLSILHAFGYALPVVTSDDIRSHNPEIEAMEPGVNGLLYRDGDVDAMVAAWRRIMDDTRLRETLSRNAGAQVLKKYTLPNMVQGFLDLTSIVDGEKRSVVTDS